MKNAIIFHGMPEEHEYQGNESEMHWLPWLKGKLEEKGLRVYVPELPKPYEPRYESWRSEFQKIPVNEKTLLIGHSCGAGFFVRFLSENNLKVGPVFLVAPWLDPHNHLKDNFFHFALDEKIVSKTEGVTILVSLDDGEDVLESVRFLTSRIPDIALKEFQNKGHFTETEMGTKEFPELLKAIEDSAIIEE